MDTLSTAPDSSGANPNSVKSDDSSPPPESRTGSPPPNCAICLGTCKNKSFTDSCLHQFCFKCLLTWSKVKAECPLCKQNFKSIIHNVRSNHQYEEYMVEQRQTEEVLERIDLDNFHTATRRFRYRTTLTLPRSNTAAIRQLLLHYPLTDAYPIAPRIYSTRRRRSPAAFRRTVYRHNLWARQLPDFTGRYRDCSPDFYRYNDTQMHRLVPWLNRELHYLLNENIGHISYVMSKILEQLPQYHINSLPFRDAMRPYFGDRTEHFLHELYCFASTPYDMTGYDRYVQYTTDSRMSSMVNEVISSSESDVSFDSDIVMISSSHPANPPPGPSRPPVPVYPNNYIPPPPSDNVIPIETISHSDTDDDSSEVMVVGYIKPPQERTPEVVDLIGSDSDVVVQENTPLEPVQSTSTQELRPIIPLVKLSLKHLEPQARLSDSDDDSTYTPPPPPRSRNRRRHTHSSTPSPTPPLSPSSFEDSTTSSFTPYDTDTDFSCTSDDSSRKRPKKKTKRKKQTKKSKRPVKDKTKSKKSSRSRGHGENGVSEPLKRNKRKSLTGKGVKASKKNPAASETVERPQGELDQPSTSGTSDRGHKSLRSHHESKRLRSVVSILNSRRNAGDSNIGENSNLLNILSSAILDPNSNVLAYNSDSSSIPADDKTRRINSVPPQVLERVDSCFNTMVADNSDEDLPLNLSVQRT